MCAFQYGIHCPHTANEPVKWNRATEAKVLILFSFNSI